MAHNISELFTNNSTCKAEPISDSIINVSLTGVRAFAELLNWSCLVIDMEEHKVIYRSNTLLYADEAKPADKQRDCDNPYWALIPEEYVDRLVEVRRNYLHYCKTFNISKGTTHHSTTDFPIIIDGHELYVNQKFTPFMMNSDGTIKLGIFVMSPSNHHKLESSIVGKGMILPYNFNTGRYQEGQEKPGLSKREKIILTRIMKGKTSKEIANELNISLSTVKTIRGRIFKKLNVKSISEALVVVRNYHLL